MLSGLPSGRFKEYQDLFPPSETPKSNLHLRHRMGKFTTDSLVRKEPLCREAGVLSRKERKRGDGLCLGANPTAGGWVPRAVPPAEPGCASSLQKCAWFTIHDIVKSICKFHREMNDDKCRMEFEGFLRKERENKEESKAGVLSPRSSLPRTLPGLGEVNGGSLWLLTHPHVLNPNCSLLEVFRELVMQECQDAKCVPKSWVMRHRTLHKQHR